MSDEAKLAVNAVKEQATPRNHGNPPPPTPPDDIIEIRALSSAEVRVSSDATRANKKRYRVFLKVVQKINMLFLVLFVCYFAWTISVSTAGNNAGDATNLNTTHNATLQIGGSSNFSGNRQIPHSSSSNNERQNNKTYHPNIILPSHRKQSKRRRKKERHKKRLKASLKNQMKSYSNLDEYLNMTGSSKKRNRKKSCPDCKIRKRKGRNRNGARKVNALTLRKILERVADETMSGARSGEGTISDLFDDASYKQMNSAGNKGDSKQKSWGGWSHEQHWVNIADPDDVYDEQDFKQKIDYSIDGAQVSPWSAWSECSTKCGPGQKERMRRCGSACKEVESMVCLNSACQEAETSEENEKALEEFYKWENDDFVPPLQLPDPEYLDPNIDSCSKWVQCSRDFTDEFIKNSSLPGCPCSFPLSHVQSKELWDTHLNRSVTWLDASSHKDMVYKPGAQNCIRSKLAPGAVTLAVQQCCYDVTNALVTRGRSAGTPNLISPEISKELHYKVDLLPWIICKGDWTRYNQVLPPDNAIQCTENPSQEVLDQQILDARNY